MDEKTKVSESNSHLTVHIDESGRQFVDVDTLFAQPSVRRTLEHLQNRLPRAENQRQASNVPKGA